MACIGGIVEALDIMEEGVEVYAAHRLELLELCFGLSDVILKGKKERKGLTGRLRHEIILFQNMAHDMHPRGGDTDLPYLREGPSRQDFLDSPTSRLRRARSAHAVVGRGHQGVSWQAPMQSIRRRCSSSLR